MNSIIETSTGIFFDVIDPKFNEVTLADAVHALPRINRFCGHTKRPLSLIEHQVNCCMEVLERGYSREAAFYALHHDDHEMYCNDLPSPVKKEIPEYKQLEKPLEHAVLLKFGIHLTEETKTLVKSVDRDMCFYECKCLMPSAAKAWNGYKDHRYGPIVSKFVKKNLNKYSNWWVYKRFPLFASILEHLRLSFYTKKYLELHKELQYA